MSDTVPIRVSRIARSWIWAEVLRRKNSGVKENTQSDVVDELIEAEQARRAARKDAEEEAGK